MLSRREFITSAIVLLLTPSASRADQAVRSATYRLEISVLFGLFTFTLEGWVDEWMDREVGTYRVLVAGEGTGITNRIESTGLIRDRRLIPTVTTSRFIIRGRESQTRITCDYDRRLVHYHHSSQTFFLGRLRVAEDTLSIPPGRPLDDVVTAALNYAGGVLEADGQSAYRTFVVRRKRPEREGPDDVQTGGYRAEIAPLRFTVTRDPETGLEVSLLDFSRFSSWARSSDPARVTIGHNRRPEFIEASLILGTRVKIRFRDTS